MSKTFIFPRSRSISEAGAWRAVLLGLAAVWLGAGAAHAQIDDISRQMGVNTTTSLSPGVDRTGVHRDFDPARRPSKPLPSVRQNGRPSANSAARNGQTDAGTDSSAAAVVKGHLGGSASTKAKAADARNRALLRQDANGAAGPPQGGRKATRGVERKVTERQGALLEPMAETRK